MSRFRRGNPRRGARAATDDLSLLFHCLVPAARWWDDIVSTGSWRKPQALRRRVSSARKRTQRERLGAGAPGAVRCSPYPGNRRAVPDALTADAAGCRQGHRSRASLRGTRLDPPPIAETRSHRSSAINGWFPSRRANIRRRPLLGVSPSGRHPEGDSPPGPPGHRSTGRATQTRSLSATTRRRTSPAGAAATR